MNWNGISRSVRHCRQGRAIAHSLALATVGVWLTMPCARADDAAGRRWQDLSKTLFAGRQVVSQPGWVSIEAPDRAMDAALVPLKLTLAEGRPISGLYVVIDENPSPVAAHITFGAAALKHELTMRIRVDQYTNIHVVVETADGQLISTQRFIKAAGGCSAPGSETPEAALRGAGRMKLRLRDAPGGAQAELLIRHPNFNGMQMDQVTRYYTPARYIDSMDIHYNNLLVMHVDTDISLASDPAIGFDFKSNGDGIVSVDVADTSHAKWHQEFPVSHGM